MGVVVDCAFVVLVVSYVRLSEPTMTAVDEFVGGEREIYDESHSKAVMVVAVVVALLDKGLADMIEAAADVNFAALQMVEAAVQLNAGTSQIVPANTFDYQPLYVESSFLLD